jgi:uncharacterized protein (DUF1697 family)
VTTSIALLRGINVGRNRKVAMADLRKLFAEAGATDVRTYIQSGNVVFDAPHKSEEALRKDLERRIEASAGFEVRVMLRTAKAWAHVVDANPFPRVEPTKLHVAFLAAKPTARAVAALRAEDVGSEEVVVAGREAYLHLPAGLARAKLPQALRLLETPVTLRNWRTVTKLLELARAD